MSKVPNPRLARALAEVLLNRVNAYVVTGNEGHSFVQEGKDAAEQLTLLADGYDRMVEELNGITEDFDQAAAEATGAKTVREAVRNLRAQDAEAIKKLSRPKTLPFDQRVDRYRFEDGRIVLVQLGQLNSSYVEFAILDTDGELEIEGSVKWDGCGNWDNNDAVLFHFCGAEDADKLSAKFKTVWNLARVLMGDSADYGEYEGAAPVEPINVEIN